MREAKTSSLKKILIWAFVLIMIAAIGWLVQWATYARPPLAESMQALQSDDRVLVTQEPWLTFTPVTDDPQAGFIFYPGGRVDPRGYASLLKVIAVQGYLIFVPDMPLNMAVFDADAADEIITAYPDINCWVIGGHSVGGTMAAQYTSKHPAEISGLAIWASYPASSADLSGFDGPVLSVYGSLDPKVNDESITERKGLLPQDTRYVRIAGGDHHQFGSYLIKPEEHFAAISAESQQAQIIQATLDLLADACGQ